MQNGDICRNRKMTPDHEKVYSSNDLQTLHWVTRQIVLSSVTRQISSLVLTGTTSCRSLLVDDL